MMCMVEGISYGKQVVQVSKSDPLWKTEIIERLLMDEGEKGGGSCKCLLCGACIG